ncbi:MAG: hypothetical protein ACM3IJ_00005, partial [Candidatus Levyibacteriota bacterium]
MGTVNSASLLPGVVRSTAIARASQFFNTSENYSGSAKKCNVFTRTAYLVVSYLTGFLNRSTVNMQGFFRKGGDFMKKLFLVVFLFVFMVIALVVSSNASADDKPSHRDNNDNRGNSSLNADSELTKSACGKRLGNPVIDVTQKVQNDADSGQAGNYWAFDYYIRHIKVWQTATGTEESPNTYCAIVKYDGRFYAIPGQAGPGSTSLSGPLINTNTNEPVNGDMSGGRRATITGTLKSSPAWTMNGNVGTTNYQCDISGNCPGVISWPGQYFDAGYSYNDDWWGWIYKAGSHGTWINAISGNSGNIL